MSDKVPAVCQMPCELEIRAVRRLRYHSRITKRGTTRPDQTGPQLAPNATSHHSLLTGAAVGRQSFREAGSAGSAATAQAAGPGLAVGQTLSAIADPGLPWPWQAVVLAAARRAGAAVRMANVLDQATASATVCTAAGRSADALWAAERVNRRLVEPYLG